MSVDHIEVAHTLEADSLICAYQRFVSRRGKPKEKQLQWHQLHGCRKGIERGTGATGPNQNL